MMRVTSRKERKDRPFIPEAAYDKDRRYTRYNEFRRARAQALKRDGRKCVLLSDAEASGPSHCPMDTIEIARC